MLKKNLRFYIPNHFQNTKINLKMHKHLTIINLTRRVIDL